MSEKIPAYDASAKCPKCGHDEVSTYYEPPIENDPCWYDRKYKPVGKWPEREFLRRTCGRCRYSWPQSAALVSEPSQS